MEGNCMSEKIEVFSSSLRTHKKSCNCSTSDDELACGERLVEKSDSVRDRAEGLLAITVALLKSKKSVDTALQATRSVSKAIELLNIAKVSFSVPPHMYE